MTSDSRSPSELRFWIFCRAERKKVKCKEDDGVSVDSRTDPFRSLNNCWLEDRPHGLEGKPGMQVTAAPKIGHRSGCLDKFLHRAQRERQECLVIHQLPFEPFPR